MFILFIKNNHYKFSKGRFMEIGIEPGKIQLTYLNIFRHTFCSHILKFIDPPLILNIKGPGGRRVVHRAKGRRLVVPWKQPK